MGQAVSSCESTGFKLLYSPPHHAVADGVVPLPPDVLVVPRLQRHELNSRKQSLKPVSHLIGPTAETRRFQAVGQHTELNLYSPHMADCKTGPPDRAPQSASCRRAVTAGCRMVVTLAVIKLHGDLADCKITSYARPAR